MIIALPLQQTYFVVRRQDPSDHLNWSLDHSRWIPSGDRISDSTWTIDGIAYSTLSVVPADVLLRVVTEDPHAPSFTDTLTTVWLESGGEHIAYYVRNHVETEQGLKKDRTFIMEVMRQ
jgi:hypothetical protein